MVVGDTVISNNSDTGNTNLNMNINMITNMDSVNNSSSLVPEHMVEMNNGYQIRFEHSGSYQTAHPLAKKGLDFFNSDLRHMANNNKAIFVNNLEKGLNHLNNSIENKGPPTEIMMIVHTEIHPNLLEAFNLELRK